MLPPRRRYVRRFTGAYMPRKMMPQCARQRVAAYRCALRGVADA